MSPLYTNICGIQNTAEHFIKLFELASEISKELYVMLSSYPTLSITQSRSKKYDRKCFL